jgi:serine/threonine-protein kinase HipA
MTTSYVPRDILYLWWLADPQQPVLVGDLRLVRSLQGVALIYDAGWLAHGFALSEDLPLRPGLEFLPSEKGHAAGAVDDARPDRWGERVIAFLDKPPRLSLMEYLYFAGDARFGALGVSTSRLRYEPRQTGVLPQLADAQTIAKLVDKVLAGEPIAPALRRLIAPGVTLGGAYPKALIEIDGLQWVVKFADGQTGDDTPLIEHACMTLAAKAGIVVAPTLAIPLRRLHAIAVKRFDRQGSRRLHALSAKVALGAASERLGYPELAQLLRRRGMVAQGINVQQMRELFRRMVFNILMDNTDDHEKNHAILVTDAQQYFLSPAFDVLPSGYALGYQQMRVGLQECDATLDNALSMCDQFGLDLDAGVAEIRRVLKVVTTWQKHFRACGVKAPDLARLAHAIDGDFLKSQRSSYA